VAATANQAQALPMATSAAAMRASSTQMTATMPNA